MSPSQFQTKKETSNNEIYDQSHFLKIHRDSHFIRKRISSCVSSSASSASVSVSKPTTVATTKPPPSRQPVIIYTRPPKVIHTNPNDFMALVQKLTGLSHPDGNPNPNSPEKEPNEEEVHGTEENFPSAISDDDVHIKSCFPPTAPTFDDPNINHFFKNISPMFMPNEYFCSSHPFFNNYDDPFLLMPNRRRSITSPPTDFEALKELPEF